MRVVDVVADAVASLGVDTFFGLVGSGNFQLTNALIARGARFVAARHEGATITMADSYARVSRRLGVCTVHQGPGLTNTVTGLTEAAKSRTPAAGARGRLTCGCRSVELPYRPGSTLRVCGRPPRARRVASVCAGRHIPCV